MASPPEQQAATANKSKGLAKVVPADSGDKRTGLPYISRENLELWLDKARGLDSPPATEAWGLGVFDGVAAAINRAVLFRKAESRIRSRIRYYEWCRGLDSPPFEIDKKIDEELMKLPSPTDEETQTNHTFERDHLLLGYLKTVSRFLEEKKDLERMTSITRRLTKIVTVDYLVVDLHDIMSDVQTAAKPSLWHGFRRNWRSAGPGADVPKSRWGRSRKIIIITNRTARDISWVLTTTTHKVAFEAGIDGIKVAADGVDVGLVFKATKTNGEGVPTQMGCVEANGENIIPVTHRGYHYITIFDNKRLHRHCENMPTKAGRSVCVYRDVSVPMEKKNHFTRGRDEDDDEDEEDDKGDKGENDGQDEQDGDNDEDPSLSCGLTITSLYRFLPWAVVALAIVFGLVATG